MDDASGQLRQRLHTSLADSRLELGYLLDHDNASRGTVQTTRLGAREQASKDNREVIITP